MDSTSPSPTLRDTHRHRHRPSLTADNDSCVHTTQQDFEMLCILDEGVAKKTLDKATVDKFETGEVRLREW